ncbi:hypothetical protein P3T23_009022 [Paraburkholderia sp. GAS448]|uniref:hypothetical protein n=1 Tax=Paraburkholderia sp. GAS448 TaxID=3035136 RepID=UPI003D1CE0D4
MSTAAFDYALSDNDLTCCFRMKTSKQDFLSTRHRDFADDIVLKRDWRYDDLWSRRLMTSFAARIVCFSS